MSKHVTFKAQNGPDVQLHLDDDVADDLLNRGMVLRHTKVQTGNRNYTGIQVYRIDNKCLPSNCSKSISFYVLGNKARRINGTDADDYRRSAFPSYLTPAIQDTPSTGRQQTEATVIRVSFRSQDLNKVEQILFENGITYKVS